MMFLLAIWLATAWKTCSEPAGLVIGKSINQLGELL